MRQAALEADFRKQQGCDQRCALGAYREWACKTKSDNALAIRPQNADPIPNNVIPEAVTRKVTRPGSRSFFWPNAVANPLPIVPKIASPAIASTSSLGNAANRYRDRAILIIALTENWGNVKIGWANSKLIASTCSIPCTPAIKIPISKAAITAYCGMTRRIIKYVQNMANVIPNCVFIAVKISKPNRKSTLANMPEAIDMGIQLIKRSNQLLNPNRTINPAETRKAPTASGIGTPAAEVISIAAPGVDQAVTTGIR